MRFTSAKCWFEHYAVCSTQIDERQCVLACGAHTAEVLSFVTEFYSGRIC
jgi:hypothetical protein